VTTHRRCVLLGAACAWAAAVTALRGQTRASVHLDLGASRVAYDDYLPSYTGFLSIDARLVARATTLTARGSALRFESGRASAQGFAAASQFLPSRGPLRAELSAVAGGSRYADLARFAHALGRLRVHRVAARRGGWLGLSLGSTAFGQGWRPVTQTGAGVWGGAGPARVDATATVTTVGDTSYTDLEAFGRLPWGPVTVEAWLGARLWSRGAGRGVYGEASASLPLNDMIAVVIGAGRYPTDPIRGTIAGRYLSAAVRITGLRAPRPGPPPLLIAPIRPGTDGQPETAAPHLEIVPADSGRHVIHVAWDGPQSVDIVGDFTDWRPLALRLVGPGLWEARVRIPGGTRRLSVRADGGPWVVPADVTEVRDEFGGLVGLVTIP